MNFKKWLKSIQTAGYNGARTVYIWLLIVFDFMLIMYIFIHVKIVDSSKWVFRKYYLIELWRRFHQALQMQIHHFTFTRWTTIDIVYID